MGKRKSIVLTFFVTWALELRNQGPSTFFYAETFFFFAMIGKFFIYSSGTGLYKNNIRIKYISLL